MPAECPDGMVRKEMRLGWTCAKEKRKALDAPMAHKTKRDWGACSRKCKDKWKATQQCGEACYQRCMAKC